MPVLSGSGASSSGRRRVAGRDRAGIEKRRGVPARQGEGTDHDGPRRGTMGTTKKTETFSAEEKAAMKERAREAKAKGDREEGTKAVLDKLAELDGLDRELAESVHAVVSEVAPELVPRTYYGMPAYAQDGRVVCFFKPAAKFKVRYATLGFTDTARLDDGAMWATEFAITELTPGVRQQIAELVRAAAG